MSPLSSPPNAPLFPDLSSDLRLSKSKLRHLNIHKIIAIDSSETNFPCKMQPGPSYLTPSKGPFSRKVTVEDPITHEIVDVYVQKKTADIIDIASLIRPLSGRGTLAKVTSVFQKTNPEPNVIYPIEETGIVLQYENRWRLYDAISGQYNTALIHQDHVIKFAKQENDKEYDAIYSKNSVRLQKIYEKIGPTPLGIQPQKKASAKTPLSTYCPENNVKKPILDHHEELPYKGTLNELIKIPISSEVFQSICACLVQGSKTFIQNNIVPLDVKLKNIGYLENGHAEHFDFGLALIPDLTKSDRVDIGGHLVKKEKEKFRQFQKDNNLSEALPLAVNMHIMQLGSVFYRLAIKEFSIPKENKDEKLLETHCNPIQQETILRMLSYKNRPTILEVEAAFPKELILGLPKI